MKTKACTRQICHLNLPKMDKEMEVNLKEHLQHRSKCLTRATHPYCYIENRYRGSLSFLFKLNNTPLIPDFFLLTGNQECPSHQPFTFSFSWICLVKVCIKVKCQVFCSCHQESAQARLSFRYIFLDIFNLFISFILKSEQDLKKKLISSNRIVLIIKSTLIL